MNNQEQACASAAVCCQTAALIRDLPAVSVLVKPADNVLLLLYLVYKCFTDHGKSLALNRGLSAEAHSHELAEAFKHEEQVALVAVPLDPGLCDRDGVRLSTFHWCSSQPTNHLAPVIGMAPLGVPGSTESSSFVWVPPVAF